MYDTNEFKFDFLAFSVVPILFNLNFRWIWNKRDYINDNFRPASAEEVLPKKKERRLGNFPIERT